MTDKLKRILILITDFRKNSHLQGLTLADSYPRGAVKVDVLIGADF